MPGAASVIPLTGGWLARKSPPYTVSSKWTWGESPSPLVFTLALMPPWAHTECERFTGTSENRSTATPASQSLMVVIRPARPPPTTAIRRTLPDSLSDTLFEAIVRRPPLLLRRSRGRSACGDRPFRHDVVRQVEAR